MQDEPTLNFSNEPEVLLKCDFSMINITDKMKSQVTEMSRI